MYHKKKIGVFISHIYGDYQTRLCTGIVRKAEEYGCVLEIFASNDGEKVGDYGLGEHSILNIPKPGHYDGFIVASSTYKVPELAEEICSMLRTRFHCPVIDINHRDSLFPRITLENNSAVKDLTLHLGKVHNYRQIYYLGNSIEYEFDKLRQNYFLEALTELSLPTEGRILSCDGTEEEVRIVLEQLISGDNPPQAIVCYNDAMTLEVISVLHALGKRVPADVAVTGLDVLEIGQQTSPVLTSVTFPIDEMGERAVELLSELWRGEEIPALSQVSAKPSIGTSCGCTDRPEPDTYAYIQFQSDLIGQREAEQFLNMQMSAQLQGVDDLDRGMDLIEHFVGRLPHCREFYLCLYDGWDRITGKLRELVSAEDPYDSDTVFLKLAIRDGKRLPECTFTKRSTLPDYLYNGGRAYIYAPLFFAEQHFGYLALSFDEGVTGYDLGFTSWLFNVNNMLKGLCDKKNLGLLTDRLTDIYTRDELTGLLNRQGFKRASDALFEQIVDEGRSACLMMFDLDCLKQINDTFGHPEGDFAIRVLAHALENSVNESCICTRQGGDEFQILAPDYDEHMASQLLDKIQNYLENYNRLHTKDYRIQASGGYSVRVPQHFMEISEMFREADQAMYEMKQSHHKDILKK